MSATPQRLVIIGTGEFGEIAYEYFTHDSPYEVVGFAVEREFMVGSTFNSLPLVPFEELEERFPPDAVECFVAVTSTQLNRVRKRLYLSAKARGYRMATYVSSRAFVWRNATVGENCFIFENNVIQHKVRIGDNCILWSGNHVGHRSIISDHCFISSHCVISGYCEIGENCFLGVNSTFADHVKVAEDCLIGAGAVMLKDALPARIYQGNPAVPRDKASSLKYFRVKE